MSTPYSIIINFLVIVFFILAFLSGELKVKFMLLGVMVLLFGLPYFISLGSLSWIFYAAKIVFGLFCYLFIRRQGYL